MSLSVQGARASVCPCINDTLQSIMATRVIPPPANRSSSVHIWLNSLETPSPLSKDSRTSPRLTRSRYPLQGTQPKATSQAHFLPGEPSRSVKRKRTMDEDDIDIHVVEPRRSGRTQRPRETTRHPQMGQSHGDVQKERGQRPPQPRRRGRPPKGTIRAAPSPILDGLDDAESDTPENTETSLPLRNDRNILGIREIPPLALSSSRTGTTRTSGRLSPSKVRGIKREHLVNLSPSIKFETVAEAKKHWPLPIQSLWTERGILLSS